MSINPQIIKLLKENAMTTYDLAKILVDRVICYQRYVKLDCMYKSVQEILDEHINAYKSGIGCSNNPNNIHTDIENADNICVNIYDGTCKYICDIFTFTDTDYKNQRHRRFL